MELSEAMRTTAAVREFTAEPVSDATLYRIFDNARFAPSGGNRQGVHVVVVRDAATRERLAVLTIPGARRYWAQVAAGEVPWNSIRPSGVSDEQIATTEPPASFIDPIRTAAAVLVVTVDLAVVASTDQNLDRVGVISGASVYPLVWNILLAAREEGLGGTLTTMAVPCEDDVRDLLGIPPQHAVACVIPLGRPVKRVTRLKRRSVDEFVTLETFDGVALSQPTEERR
jgi:nitroreductase